jgi:hypothetical protein
MQYQGAIPATQTAYQPDYILGRRRHLARVTLFFHVAAVLVVLLVMAGTEGRAAQGNGHSVALAEVQLLLIAVAALAEVFLIGRWTRYALMVRRAQSPPPLPAGAQPQSWERSAQVGARTERGMIRVMMTMTVVTAWLAEIGFVLPAVYQVTNGGNGDPDTVFTGGMFILFAIIAGTSATAKGFAWVSDRSRTKTIDTFAPLTSPALMRDDPDAALTKLRQAQIVAQRRIRTFAALAIAITIVFVIAAATGQLDARVDIMTPALIVANLGWAARWKKVLNATRRTEASLLARQARPVAAYPGNPPAPAWPGMHPEHYRSGDRLT